MKDINKICELRFLKSRQLIKGRKKGESQIPVLLILGFKDRIYYLDARYFSSKVTRHLYSFYFVVLYFFR